MRDFLDILCRHLHQGQRVALATVVRQQGSAPRGTGSKLLAHAEGLLCGSVGGGLVEGQTLDVCRHMLRDLQQAHKGAQGLVTTRVLDFNLSGELAAGSDMICGGHVRILVDVVEPADLPLFSALRASLDAAHGKGALLVSRVGEDDDGSPRRVLLSEGGHGPRLGGDRGMALPEEAEKILRAGLARAALSTQGPGAQPLGSQAEASWLFQAMGTEYYVEPWLPPYSLILAGGGHVSRPTAQVAALAGFAVTVLDDREEFSQPQRFPWACTTATVPDFVHCFRHLPLHSRTCVVIVTRGHVHDAAVLRQALDSEAGYVGMIGSRRKKEEIYSQLRAQGVSEVALSRVCCPVGLSIGAETPEEIAVSIVAQCIAYRRGRL